MKSEQNKTEASGTHFELKYCERCGVLWVRPVGREQIYCAGCGREMADLPPASHEADGLRRRDLWSAEEIEFEGWEDYEECDLSGPGGVA